MRLLLVAKSAYSGVHDDGRSYPAILSGHTVGFVRGLVRAARTRGDRITYVFPGFAGPAEVSFFDAADPVPVDVDARPYWDEPLPKSAVSSAPVELCALLADICRSPATRPDVAAFVYPFPLLVLAAPVLDAAGVPYVASFRGGDAYRWLVPPAADAPAGAVAIRAAYLAALQGASSLTAASSWLADQARKAELTVDGIVGSPPPGDDQGVSPSGAATDPADAMARKRRYLDEGYRPIAGEDLRPDRLWLLWSGRLSPDKRPDLALRAFGAFRQAARHEADRWQLVIAGDGDRSLLPGALPPGVAHVFVPPRCLPHVLRAADGALHTAVPGGFVDSRPSSVLAASAYGLPCITVRSGDVGGTDECVSPGVLARLGVERPEHPEHLERPDDEDAVVAGLAASIAALSDDAERRRLSLDAASWAREEGLWDTMERFLDLTAKAICP
jgi:glycosyltransferase involved in cell wall biosynthesis